MNKRQSFFLYAFILLTIASIAFLTAGYMYYASAAPQKPYHIPSQADDTIRVAFIGDSRAFYHKKHNSRMAQFIASDTKAPATVVSRGFCGARSGRIYKAMFSEKGETFKDILTKAPHFCIVAVGVNDTYTKTGANAYATIIRSRYWNDSPKLYKRYAKNEK